MQRVIEHTDNRNVSYMIFPSEEEVAEYLAVEFTGRIRKAMKNKSPVSVAVSGGSSPVLFFSLLAGKYSQSVDWKMVKIFWVDERCVPPEDAESNYGMTNKLLLSRIEIPVKNIFRIQGESDPEKEAVRYSALIAGNTKMTDSVPLFDLVILGMGEDGHTASIFPGDDRLLKSSRFCGTAIHPESGQKRVSLTAKVINNSGEIFFLVTGSKKSIIVNDIFTRSSVSADYPASFIKSGNGKTTWLLDSEAGKLILP